MKEQLYIFIIHNIYFTNKEVTWILTILFYFYDLEHELFSGFTEEFSYKRFKTLNLFKNDI